MTYEADERHVRNVCDDMGIGDGSKPFAHEVA